MKVGFGEAMWRIKRYWGIMRRGTERVLLSKIR